MTLMVPDSKAVKVYTIRRDKRAKTVKLTACRKRGVIVTVPYRFNAKELPALLAPHQKWLEQQYQRLEKLSFQQLPTQLFLPSLDETWQIKYLLGRGAVKTYIHPNHELVLLGNIDDIAACRQSLTTWVRRYAAQFLEKTLKTLSEKTGLTYRQVVIRNQRTIWGSCTADKVINLNFKLIFLSHAVLRYVLIHELCHTKHMDHSRSFWALVSSFDSAWREHRGDLRHADDQIPSWLV